MLRRDRTARGYFLGQLPDDHADVAGAPPTEPAGDEHEVGFDSVSETQEHLDRVPATGAADLHDCDATPVDEQELSRATTIIEPDDAAIFAAPPRHRAARRQAKARRRRRTRLAAAVTVVAVLLAATGLYVRTQADAAGKRARRSTPTSREQGSTSTAGTPAPLEAAPATEPVPLSAAALGSRPSAQQGPTSSSRGNAPRVPAPASLGPAPGSSGAPPASDSPPSSPPPRDPTCQLLPVVCP